jgi:hypothetical protein
MPQYKAERRGDAEASAMSPNAVMGHTMRGPRGVRHCGAVLRSLRVAVCSIRPRVCALPRIHIVRNSFLYVFMTHYTSCSW